MKKAILLSSLPLLIAMLVSCQDDGGTTKGKSISSQKFKGVSAESICEIDLKYKSISDRLCVESETVDEVTITDQYRNAQMAVRLPLDTTFHYSDIDLGDTVKIGYTISWYDGEDNTITLQHKFHY